MLDLGLAPQGQGQGLLPLCVLLVLLGPGIHQGLSKC